MKSSKQQAIELAKQEEFWKALNSYGSAIPDNVKFSLANDFHKIISKEYDNWIKIESEKDLPSEDCFCEVVFQDGTQSFDRYLFRHKNFNQSHWKHITHYAPIEKRQPPIH